MPEVGVPERGILAPVSRLGNSGPLRVGEVAVCIGLIELPAANREVAEPARETEKRYEHESEAKKERF